MFSEELIASVAKRNPNKTPEQVESFMIAMQALHSASLAVSAVDPARSLSLNTMMDELQVQFEGE